jgi:invasion protein IalB
VAGYTYKKDSGVTIKIGSQTLELFTSGGTAWAKKSRTDRALAKAMKRGNTMTVAGTSNRGTKTLDTYSLKGFTAAYNAIGTNCEKK